MEIKHEGTVKHEAIITHAELIEILNDQDDMNMSEYPIPKDATITVWTSTDARSQRPMYDNSVIKVTWETSQSKPTIAGPYYRDVGHDLSKVDLSIVKLTDVPHDWFDGYYYFKSERASHRSIAQLCLGNWHTINEEGPLTLEELNRRGWELDEKVKL